MPNTSEFDRNEFDENVARGRRAFQYIVDNSMAPTPRNYELWFHYVGSHNKALLKAVNEAVRANGKLSEADAQRIYLEHLSPDRGGDTVGEVGVKIGREIDNVVSMLDGAAGKSNAYGASLDSVAEQLGTQIEGSGGGTLAQLVELLMASTREMTANNRALESSLQESKQQIAELNLHLDAIRNESRTDQLTGIANRKHFDEQLYARMNEAARTGDELCLLVADIDHFKKFNDTFGHQTGDQVLRLVAQALKGSVKGDDLAARYGGEEFAVVLPATNLKAAVAVGNNIRKAVMAKELVKKSTGENLGTITMSFGAARYRAGESEEELIGRADQCLYAAKNGGRNLVKCETDPDVDVKMAVAS